MNNKFQSASEQIRQLLRATGNQLELSHAENTLYWLQIMEPDADDVLCLAALAHDLERSVGEKVRSDDYPSYDTYKAAHAARSGFLARGVLEAAGFQETECQRVAEIISAAEFSSADPAVQLVCDADSISFFDSNIETYIAKKGFAATRSKAEFMYSRASSMARQHIKKLLAAKQLTDLIGA